MLVFGTYLRDGSEKRGHLPWHERCLPSTSVSSCGLLALLCRWCAISKSGGGLNDNDDRAACDKVLESIMFKFQETNLKDFLVTVQLVEKWSSRWPRPLDPEIPSFKVHIVDGVCDFKELFELGTRRAPLTIARKWCRLMECLVDAVGPAVGLQRFLLFVVRQPGLQPMFAQIVVGITCRLDFAMAREVLDTRRGRGPRPGRVTVRFMDDEQADALGNRMEKMLIQHVAAGRRCFEGCRVLGLATDKANVKGLNLQNSIVVNTKGFAVLTCPQVCPAADHEAPPDLPGSLRSAAQKAQASVAAAASRQRGWLVHGKNKLAFRPTKKYRVSAKHWLDSLDNQVRVSANNRGLVEFQPEWESPVWKDWRHYPFLAVGMDLGSDGCSAGHSLAYLWKTNIEMLPDHAHGANRSVICALKSAGLYGLTLLWLVHVNLLHGPDKEDYRYHQCREHLRELYSSSTAAETPLFLFLASRIITAMKHLGFDFVSGQPLEQQAWQFLSERAAFLKEGERTSMCRFQAVAASLSKNVVLWPIHLFDRTYVALEEDVVSGNKFLENFCRFARPSDAPGEGGGATSARAAFEDRILRACSQNCVTISVGLLPDSGNERIFCIMSEATKSVLEWDSGNRQLCRDGDGCADFMIGQCSGDYMKHVEAITAILHTVKSLELCQFIVTESEASLRKGSAGDVITEDDFADILGQFSWSLAVERIKRGLWLCRGWPWSMCRILSKNEACGDRCLKEFADDHVVFDALAAHGGRCATADAMLRRHCFQKTSVVQFKHAFADPAASTPQWKEDFKKLVLSHARVAVPTVAVVDLIGTQKSVKTLKRGSKYARVEKSMAIVIRKGVLEKRHRWTVPARDVPLGPKTARISNLAFHAKAKARSMPFNNVVSTKQAANYYSPAAENVSHNVADLAVLRDCHSRGDSNLVDAAWIGEVASVPHKLMLGVPSAAGTSTTWYHLLFHYTKSGVIAWPVVRKNIGPNTFPFDHGSKISKPVVLSMCSIEGLVACTFEWRSWLWQVRNLPEGVRLPVRVRAVAEGEPKPLLEVMAARAFWNMGASEITQFASLKPGVELPHDGSLCNTVVAAIKGILGVDDRGAVDIAAQRLARNDLSANWVKPILDIDEAVEVLEKHDVQLVQQEQQDSLRRRKAEAVAAKAVRCCRR